MDVLSGVFAAALACVHIFARELDFGGGRRSPWLSAAGGVALAYVFMHLLPELSHGQEVIERAGLGQVANWLENHAYMMALVGLLVFYGLERAAVTSRRAGSSIVYGDGTSVAVFRSHVGSFAAYNVLIGYLLVHRERETELSLVLYAFAMALHFMVNDHGLRLHHRDRYDRRGRWALAFAVIAGWGIGQVVVIEESAFAMLFAFLMGGLVLNVLKEELPEERQSRFWPFALGALAYAALLLVL